MNETPGKYWKQLAFELGIVLLVAGLIWVLTLVFLDEPLREIVAVVLMIGGFKLGVFRSRPLPLPAFKWVRGGITVLFLGLAVWAWLPPAPEAEMKWRPYSEEAVAQAAREKKPVMIDFYADWCGPCIKLDQQVFSRREVVDAAERFVRLRADFSVATPETDAIAEKYSVVAFPTVILIGSDGVERSAVRLIGYEPAARFLGRLRVVQ